MIVTWPKTYVIQWPVVFTWSSPLQPPAKKIKPRAKTFNDLWTSHSTLGLFNVVLNSGTLKKLSNQIQVQFATHNNKSLYNYFAFNLHYKLFSIIFYNTIMEERRKFFQSRKYKSGKSQTARAYKTTSYNINNEIVKKCRI